MKKTLLALALLGTFGAANAQTQPVQPVNLILKGVESINEVVIAEPVTCNNNHATYVIHNVRLFQFLYSGWNKALRDRFLTMTTQLVIPKDIQDFDTEQLHRKALRLDLVRVWHDSDIGRIQNASFVNAEITGRGCPTLRINLIGLPE
jgi:hypothetical protein